MTVSQQLLELILPLLANLSQFLLLLGKGLIHSHQLVLVSLI